MINKDIDEALRFDSLSAAEKLTGTSYKEDDQTMALGFAMNLAHSKRKRSLLSAANDTYFSMPFDSAVEVMELAGFEIVLTEKFFGKTYWDDEVAVEETFHILWHPDGILAEMDSYKGKSMNSGKIYYNVVFNPDLFQYVYDYDTDEQVLAPEGTRGYCTSDGVSVHDYTSSGSYFDYDGESVWVGDHDSREGVRHKINALREIGAFLPQWRERPFMWLVHHNENSDNYEQITEERIARLPEHVRNAITPQEGGHNE